MIDPVSLSLGAMRLLGLARKYRKAIGFGLLAVVVLGVFAFVGHRIDRHFDGVAATATARDSALAEARRLGERVKSLDNAIDANRRAYDFERQQLASARLVAEQERDAAVARANRYERIRDAALASPPEDRSAVSPVVRDTIDRLWPQPAADD